MRYVKQKNQMSLKEYEKFFRDNFQPATLVAYRYIGDHALVEDINLSKKSIFSLQEVSNS